VEGRIGERISTEIEVTHVDSRQCPCVQAVDFLAGAIGRRYKYEDGRYYAMIEHRITIGLEFFEPKNSMV